MSDTGTSRQTFSRKEAAIYITNTYRPIAPSTLDRYAQQGVGPEFRYALGNAGSTYYDKADIDRWWDASSTKSAKTQAPRTKKKRRTTGGALRGALATG